MSRRRPASYIAAAPAVLYQRLFGVSDDAAAGRAVVAVIWATVDRDRIVAGLGLAADPLPNDQHLGASVVLVRHADGDPIAILEPITEGRLTATLARHGEGPAGEYVESAIALDEIGPLTAASGVLASRPAEGPFGRSVIVPSSPPDGPHLVLVESTAGTIRR